MKCRRGEGGGTRKAIRCHGNNLSSKLTPNDHTTRQHTQPHQAQSNQNPSRGHSALHGACTIRIQSLAHTGAFCLSPCPHGSIGDLAILARSSSPSPHFQLPTPPIFLGNPPVARALGHAHIPMLTVPELHVTAPPSHPLRHCTARATGCACHRPHHHRR